MGLKHLKLITDTVEAPGGTFTVRGLSFVDITAIVTAHRDVLSALFDSVKANGGKLDLDNGAALLSSMIVQAPEAAALIISTAADEEDTSIALGFVFPVQLDALEKIARMTFASEGGLKKVVETIVRVLQGTTSAMQGLQA